MNETLPRAWLVAAFGEDRQYAGNAGYADDLERKYRYDSLVPNSLKIAEGDLLVLRDRHEILGVSRLCRIDAERGQNKILHCCVRCGRSGLKKRTRKTPTYRCHFCKEEFEQPRERNVSVTRFTALFDGAFVPVRVEVDMAKLRSACPHFNEQHAMQELLLDQLGEYGAPLRAAAIALLARPDLHRMPTADDRELEHRATALRSRGHVEVPRGQAHPRRVATGEGERFERDPSVRAWVLQEAHEHCESCGQPGPFELESGDLYLEVHHVLGLARGGGDTIDNTVALCPNCHRALHLAGDRGDRMTRLYGRVARLVRQCAVVADA